MYERRSSFFRSRRDMPFSGGVSVGNLADWRDVLVVVREAVSVVKVSRRSGGGDIVWSVFVVFRCLASSLFFFFLRNC